jgi:hypothetical protein
VDETQQPKKPLIDRYRQLLAELGAQAVADKLTKIEARIWGGRLGEVALFAEELEMVQKRGESQREGSGEVAPDLLILCVGYSPEPLLLATAFLAPTEVLLLQERRLQAPYLATLAKLWDRYRPSTLPEFELLRSRTVRGDAADLFLSVREIVEERPRNGSRIVLDITGAKKSMVAGAFLAAGFLEIETSYVDFDDYDPVLRRPLPGTSKPGRLVHPYSLFKLREESRLEEELDSYHYREAEGLARTLREMAQTPEVVEMLAPGEAYAWAARFEAVEQTARAYRHWSEGFYCESAEVLERSECGIPVPATVERLRAVWPRSTDPHQAIVAALLPGKVFREPSTALAYFLDILVWNTLKRIEEHPREIFLRLYGTVESVIFFAFHVFVTRFPERLLIKTEEADKLQAVQSRYAQGRRGKSLDWERFLRGVAIEAGEDNSGLALKLLAGKSYVGGPKAKVPRGWQGWPSAGVAELPECSIRLPEPALPEALNASLFEGAGEEGIHFSTFNMLRHKAVHWLAPVPAEMAEKLLRYYRAVLQGLIPHVIHSVREDEPDEELRDRLDEWEQRLLDAAGGRIADDCRPWSYRAVKERVTLAQSRGERVQLEVRDADLRGR